MKSRGVAGMTMAMLGLALVWMVPAFGAAVTGTIVYEGEIPVFKGIVMSEDPVCASKHTEPMKPEILVLGDNRTLANVFVQVKSGLPDTEYPVPEEPVILDQHGCRFAPHVFGIRAGQSLKILNPDGTLHNVHVMPRKNRGFNMAMPQFKKSATKMFSKAESMFPIKCDVHSWMSAWCAVLDHPFFTVTATDGTFKIEGLDAGTYEIEAWHERLGTQTATVTVGADDAAVADFTFTRP